MREAYFDVGEEVILQSRGFPELNGNATVISKVYGVRRSSFDGISRKGWAYYLDVVGPNEAPWREASLRKKHKPSEFSFEELINQKAPISAN
jgi:hypothetical protein